MTTISVVIPVLNDSAMLRVCLDALAAQTRPADEIVVVDNGSTDDSAAVAVAAGARVIRQPQRGIFPATSAGFDAATGDVLARLDADSIPPADWLARIDSLLAASDGLTAVTGPGDFYGGTAIVRWLGRKLYIGGLFWSMNILLGHPPLFGSNFAMPAAIWRRLRDVVNSDVSNIHDDLDLSWHFEPDMNVLLVPDLTVAISARPFSSLSALGRRVGWVYTTLSLDFREQSPWERRRARRASAEPEELAA